METSWLCLKRPWHGSPPARLLEHVDGATTESVVAVALGSSACRVLEKQTEWGGQLVRSSALMAGGQEQKLFIAKYIICLQSYGRAGSKPTQARSRPGSLRCSPEEAAVPWCWDVPASVPLLESRSRNKSTACAHGSCQGKKVRKLRHSHTVRTR